MSASKHSPSDESTSIFAQIDELLTDHTTGLDALLSATSPLSEREQAILLAKTRRVLQAMVNLTSSARFFQEKYKIATTVPKSQRS